jgi:hypothetical protein
VRVSREVDRTDRVVLLCVSGEIDDGGLLQLAAEIRTAGDVPRDFALLMDLRNASGLHVTADGVRTLVAQPLVFSPASRRAVVVPTDLGFGMARMYEMLREESVGGMRAFRDFDEARRWVMSRSG